MDNVKQTQKMIPFITCEVSLGQYVCELVFGVNVFDLDFGVQIDSIKQPIKSNSVGSGNLSHCRASSLYDHLDHCFVVFKHIQRSFLMKRLDVWVNNINSVQIIDHSLRLLAFVNRVRWRRSFTFVQQRVSPFYTVQSRVSEKCGDTIQPQSCIQRDDFWLFWTVWNWSLFLAHRTYWKKSLTSQNAQCSTRSRFGVLKIHQK